MATGVYFSVDKNPAYQWKRIARRWGILGLLVVLVGGVAFIPLALGYGSTPFEEWEIGQEENDPTRAAAWEGVGPKDRWIAIDTASNRLTLESDTEGVLRNAICSVGTGAILRDESTQRSWVFDSPRGKHRVLSKRKNPVWHKPDWAFIEEGLPIPKDPAQRLDPYALGRFALYFGDGYLIHGTLYQRLLGRSVTHGCIRLGDEDLESVYRQSPIGTPIYIF